VTQGGVPGDVRNLINMEGQGLVADLSACTPLVQRECPPEQRPREDEEGAVGDVDQLAARLLQGRAGASNGRRGSTQMWLLLRAGREAGRVGEHAGADRARGRSLTDRL